VSLAAHYRRFRVEDRLLLTGHSHQAWPDVALEGVTAAFDDAAMFVDEKWERAFAQAERVREGFRLFLGDPGAEIALGGSTHDLVLRFLSALDLRARPRLISTHGEFHTVRRQLARLAETGLVDVVLLPPRPADTLADRLAEAIDDRTAAVLVSAVLFEDARVVAGLEALADACAEREVELLIDAYHALGPVSFKTPETAWVVGGGYKYLQLGEGNCFLRVPEHARSWRPVITGWYAEFDALARVGAADAVAYGQGAAAFAGSTYDPTSHYRAARVFQFFVEQGLTPEALEASYRRQVAHLARAFDALEAPEELITRDRETPLDRFGGFLALRCADAATMQRELAVRGVATDSRREFLRLGPALYLSDAQLDQAVAVLGAVIAARKDLPSLAS
jgi:kynureninase